MFEFLKGNNRLKREELINITKKFIGSINKYPIFEIPDKNYLDYFEEIKQKLSQYEFKEDTRFVTYGRLSFLKTELTDRLKDDKLKEPDPNWKDKWDNRMGAFWDLSDYIRGDRYISIGQVPKELSFHEVLRKNDEYYKDGFICKQEKELILEMINEIEEYIYQKNSKEENKMGLFDKFSKKYNINPEDNMPQIVYGPPPSFENKMVFNAYEGGCFGESDIFYVEKNGDKYKFKSGSYPAGKIPIPEDDSKFNVSIKTEVDYKKLINDIKEATKNWEKEYVNPNILDGTQWNITAEEFGINFFGSNEFPSNYSKVKKIIIKHFKGNNFFSKYDIEPEDNIPREVYGIPSPIQKELDKDKYEVNPEKNVPQRVYGVPSPAKVSDENMKDKYDVNPEKNVPQKVYGVMNSEKFKLDLDKRNKESISIIIGDYCLSLTKWGKTCDLLFMNKSKESFIKDSIVSIPLDKFDIFVSKINPIVSEWKNEYSGIKNIKWQVKFNTKELNKTIVGNGEYPVNWNKFVDLISEYEVLFKKTIIYNNKENNVNLNASFEEIEKQELEKVEEEIKNMKYSISIKDAIKNFIYRMQTASDIENGLFDGTIIFDIKDEEEFTKLTEDLNELYNISNNKTELHNNDEMKQFLINWLKKIEEVNKIADELIEKYNTAVENNLPTEDLATIWSKIKELRGITKQEIFKDKLEDEDKVEYLEGNLNQEEVDLLNKNSWLPINLLSNDVRILEMQQIEGLSSFRNIMSYEYHCKDFLIEFSGYPTDESIYRATKFHLYTSKYDFVGIRVGITKKEDVINTLLKYNFEIVEDEENIKNINDKVFKRKNCKVVVSFQDNIINRLDIKMETKYLGNRLY